MTTLACMVHDYTKKHAIQVHSEEYLHTYADGSTELFTIETADKEVRLYGDGEWWSANVPTKRFMVTVRGSVFHRLDWFDGRRFKTVQAAIKAIQK